MTLAVTVVAPGPREEVWARWSDLPAWPDWNPVCLSAELDGPLCPGTRVEMRLRHPRGRDFFTRPVLTAVEPAERLAWQATAPGLVATTDSALQAEGDGTRVTVSCDSRGRLAFAFKMTLPERAQATMFTDMLDALSRSFGGQGSVGKS